MIVIHKYAEERLPRLLAAVKGNTSRCIYLRQHPAAPHRLPGLMHECAAVDEGYILVCADGDSFIIADGVSDESFMRLKEKMGIPAQDTETAAMFDARRDIAQLLALASEKLLAYEQARRQKSAESEKPEAPSAKNFPNKVSLLATLPQRRQTRKGIAALVVETDLFSRRLLAATLQDSVFVATAERAETAFAVYLREAPDIVLLSADLPDETALSLLRQLRHVDPEACVVMLAGENPAHAAAALQLGAGAVIEKPYTREKLLPEIDRCAKHAGQAQP